MELVKHDLKPINAILDYNNPNQTIEQLAQRMAHNRKYGCNIDRRVVL